MTYSNLCLFEKTETKENLENLNFNGKQMIGVLFSSCYFHAILVLQL